MIGNMARQSMDALRGLAMMVEKKSAGASDHGGNVRAVQGVAALCDALLKEEIQRQKINVRRG